MQKVTITSFDLARATWELHECDSDSDVCGCVFRFNCTQCGKPQTTFGESMPFLRGIGGKCEACHYEINTRVD